jgi:hypothetical protein
LRIAIPAHCAIEKKHLNLLVGTHRVGKTMTAHQQATGVRKIDVAFCNVFHTTGVEQATGIPNLTLQNATKLQHFTIIRVRQAKRA